MTGDSPSNSVKHKQWWSIRLPVVSNFEERAKYMYQRETTRGERRVACSHISRALARGDCLSFVSLEATQSKNVSDMLSFRKPHFSLIWQAFTLKTSQNTVWSLQRRLGDYWNPGKRNLPLLRQKWTGSQAGWWLKKRECTDIFRIATNYTSSNFNKKSFKRGGHTLHQPSGVAITLRMRKKALRRPNPKAKAMVVVYTIVAATDAINRNKVW